MRSPLLAALGLRCLVSLLALPVSALGEMAVAQDPDAGAPGGSVQGQLVRSIRVEGLQRYTEQQVIAALDQKVGRPYDPAAGRRAAFSLWESFRILVLDVRLEGDVLVLEVQEQPVDAEPRFIGNDSIKTGRLLEWAGLSERSEVYLHEAARTRYRLLQGYRKHGYHFAEVEVVMRGTEDSEPGATPDVIFEIREGPKVRCTGVFVNGNDSLENTGWGFWSGGLFSLAKLETKGRGLFRWRGKTFIKDALQADLVAMRKVYRDLGWLDAKVEIQRLAFNDDRDRVKVHLVVDEGERYRIATVRVVAYERGPGGEPAGEAELLFSEQELIDLLEMVPGAPYEQSRIVHDQRALRSHYGERGYLDSRNFARPSESQGWQFLEPDRVVDYEKHEIHLVYRMFQGRQRTIREVRLRGNTHTRDRVLRREISALPGKVANTTQIERSLGRIAGTGYFTDQVDLRHADPQFVFRETGSPDLVDLEYLVEEGRVVDFQLSGGVASDSGVIGLIKLSMRNFDAQNTPRSVWATPSEIYRKEAFHGDGELFTIDLSPGSEVNFWRIRYRHPDIFGSQFDPYSLDNQFERRDRRFRSHDEQRTRLQMNLGRLFGRNFSLSAGPIYQVVDLSDFDEGALPQVLIDSDPESTFSGLSLNARYSTLDNILNPSEGHYTRLRNEIYGGLFGGDEEFVKSQIFYDYYRPLGDPELDARPGIYIGLVGGIASPQGDTNQVHYAERFFLGGSTNLRGFRFRGVGPFEGDYPVGGETYATGTLEYRFPLYTVAQPGTSRRREMFRGILFADAGVSDPKDWNLDLDELRASVGFGFGLSNPIPLTFNFGFPIREGAEDDTEVFSFRLSFR